jgi:hypothetical protein
MVMLCVVRLEEPYEKQNFGSPSPSILVQKIVTNPMNARHGEILSLVGFATSTTGNIVFMLILLLVFLVYNLSIIQ